MAEQLIPENVKRSAQVLGKAINETLPPDWGFTLLVFSYAEAGQGKVMYLSSARRGDMVNVMKEFIERQERGMIDEDPLHN